MKSGNTFTALLFAPGFLRQRRGLKRNWRANCCPSLSAAPSALTCPSAVNAAFKMADDYLAEVERRHDAAAASTQTMPPLRHPDGSLARGWTEGFPEITGRDDA